MLLASSCPSVRLPASVNVAPTEPTSMIFDLRPFTKIFRETQLLGKIVEEYRASYVETSIRLISFRAVRIMSLCQCQPSRSVLTSIIKSSIDRLTPIFIVLAYYTGNMFRLIVSHLQAPIYKIQILWISCNGIPYTYILWVNVH